MTADQLAAWRRAIAAKAKAARRQRGNARKPAISPGMIRKAPETRQRAEREVLLAALEAISSSTEDP